MKRIALFSFVLLMFACSQPEEECKDCTVENTDTIVDPEQDLNAALEKEKLAATPSKDQKENHQKIVKKFGEQWDFCTCVVANDSITDAFEKKLTTAQENKLMARWEYVDKKCKELTTAPNTTPEERDKHEKKVNNCLKENGLKK